MEEKKKLKKKRKKSEGTKLSFVGNSSFRHSFGCMADSAGFASLDAVELIPKTLHKKHRNARGDFFSFSYEFYLRVL